MTNQAPDARRPTSVSKSITLAGRTFVLRYDFEAVGVLEDLYDAPIKRVAEKLKDPEEFRVKDIEKVLYAGMIGSHPDMRGPKDDPTKLVREALNAAVEAGQEVTDILGDTFSAFDASAGQDGPQGDPQTAAT